MDYAEAVRYIAEIERGGSDYGIERMRELLVLLSEPDRKLKFVHVAGTNGKGSVCAFLTSILVAAGYKVGTYISPSVFCYNERFRIGGVPISDEDLARHMTAVADAIERQRALSGVGAFLPTAFEIETALAFLAFEDARCDICVLETGLGGRWDATNVVYEKELAVLTPVALDHCGLLGDTPAEIAAEKAAIVRDVGVTCAQAPEAEAVLAAQGKIRKCAGPTLIERDRAGQSFSVGDMRCRIRLAGCYQPYNAALAVGAVAALREKGWRVSDEAVKEGLLNARWPARFEIVDAGEAAERFGLDLPPDATLVLDGAHNPHGAAALARSLGIYFSGEIVAVTGVLADKDYAGILRELLPIADKLIAVTPPSPRALPADALAAAAARAAEKSGLSREIRVADKGIKESVQAAFDEGAKTVALCGSLTLFKELQMPRRGNTAALP